MRIILSLLLLHCFAFAEDLPLLGLAHAGVRVSDIAKAQAFYTGVLGYEMPFDLKMPDGNALMLQYYKVNDRQFLEIYPNLKPDAVYRMTHVAFVTDDVEKLHKLLDERGLKPGPINSGRDGNKSCGVKSPPGQQLGFLEFTQYLPGSLHAKTLGEDMSAKRLSNHMQFAGIVVTDLNAALQFYRTMGFQEIWRGTQKGMQGQLIDLQLPGKSGDFVELVDQPLPIAREQAGLAQHFGLAGQDLPFLYKLAVARGAKTLGVPEVGPQGKLQFGILDPDGTLVEIREGPAVSQRSRVKSTVTIYNIDDGSKKAVYTAEGFYQAPNWSPDGKYLLMNSPGKLVRLSLDGANVAPVETGAVKSINNDHGITRDGKWYAVSAGNIFVLPSTGGEPRQITHQTPSYFHGFSPDGKWMSFCAQRNGNFDIYRAPFDGGPEERLTTSSGYDDGSEYSPDGKWIYFNSNRSGSWDIWRMPASGAGPNDAKAEQITNDELEDWFPHLSPDGKWLVLISFQKGIPNHPANQNVALRIMPAPGAKPTPHPKLREIVKLFGGQGTINVNSWSPDSKRFAYVSYELLKP